MIDITSVEHIGIAVKELQEAIQFYEEKLGLKCYKIEEVSEQQVITAFFNAGNVKVELISPIKDGVGPIAKYLDSKGEGLHHIAFKVKDLSETIGTLKNSNVDMINTSPAPGADQMEIAFAHPKSCHGVLTEFCSPNLDKQGID